MSKCMECLHAAGYLNGRIVCINKRSTNYGRVLNGEENSCQDFAMGKCSTSLNLQYLWCETCKRTIYPEFELDEHKDHEIYIDREIEDIVDYLDMIITGAD